MLENLLAKEMVESMTKKQRRELLAQAMRWRNSFMLAPTLAVMAKHKNFNDIELAIRKNVQAIQLGTEFANVLGQCLIEVGGKNDVTIRRYARFVNHEASEYEMGRRESDTVTYEEFAEWADEEVLLDSPSDWERMNTVKVRTNLERALSIGLQNFAKRAVDELVRRGEYGEIAAALEHANLEECDVALRKDFPRKIALYILDQAKSSSYGHALIGLCADFIELHTPSPEATSNALSVLEGRAAE